MNEPEDAPLTFPEGWEQYATYEDSCLTLWDLAGQHADVVVMLTEQGNRLTQSTDPEHVALGFTLLRAARDHQALTAACLALGGFGDDEEAHHTFGAPYRSADDWDV
jgi:hypothetical protein